MIAPAVMFIEMAADSLADLATRKPLIKDAQRYQLQSFGDERAKKLGATGLSEDFTIGYELGLQTARVLLAGMPSGAEVSF